MNDTICAISTAVGVGGISIIRVSGNEAIKITNSIFKGKDLEKVDSHTINYGKIVDGKTIIDECLVSVMRSPKTYTTEDVTEINLHGGIATTNKVLEMLLESGCRLAEPGEFTKRAFLNGRIDLVEAEAVSDLINANTENARRLSINNLSGSLSEIINRIKEKLLDIETHIEVNIDYPEYEDIEDMTNEKIIISLENIRENFRKLISESKNAKFIKNGVNIALLGRPNVGKSSILNFLLEEDRAIVTNIEGTTRDIIEGQMILQGNLINFIDTAGIRDTSDIIEKIGVDKSISMIDTADLIILVLNNNENINAEDIELIKKIAARPHIIFVNKNDLDSKIELDCDYITGNTIKKDGLDALKGEIIRFLNLENLNQKDFTYVSNARQLSLIKRAKESIESAIINCKNGLPVDIVEVDLTLTRKYLDEILGNEYSEELIEELFSKFCLGK